MQIPQYRQLYESLKHQIISGVYQPDDLLPSENQLAEWHQITRMTVRQALKELLNEGYIRKHQGKGTFVNFRQKSVGTWHFEAQKSDPTSTLVVQSSIIGKPSIQAWDKAFPYPLTTDEQQAGCIQALNLLSITQKPVLVEQFFLPNINVPGFIMTPFVNASIIDSLRVSYHIEAAAIEQSISATLAQANEALWLQIPLNTPLLQIWRRYTTNRTGFYFYSKAWCCTQDYALCMGK